MLVLLIRQLAEAAQAQALALDREERLTTRVRESGDTLSALEAKCAALTAENASLKRTVVAYKQVCAARVRWCMNVRVSLPHPKM